MPGGSTKTKTITASRKAPPTKHKEVKRSAQELDVLREKYKTIQKAASPLLERHNQLVENRAVLAEEAGVEDPTVASTKAACDFSGDVEGLEGMHNIVFTRNTPLAVADSSNEEYSAVGSYWGVSENPEGNPNFKNAADAEADAVGTGGAGLENHTARGIVTCGTRTLKGLVCAQCRTNDACYLQSPAHIVAAVEASAKLTGGNAAQLKSDDIDLFVQLATSDKPEDDALLTELRCVCNDPSCLLASGMKTVPKCMEWHETGEYPNRKGRNVRHGSDADIQDGLHLARERFLEIPEGISDAEAQLAMAQVAVLVNETLSGSYQLRSWEVIAATTATQIVAHQKDIGVAIPDASDFISRMQSAPRVVLRELALAHVTTKDWSASGQRIVIGPGENRGKDWSTYLDSVILDQSSGFPNAWVLGRVFLTIRNYEANNFPKDSSGKPVHRVRQSQMCDYWGDCKTQAAHLRPYFADKAFKQTIAYLSSACSAEHSNGANKTNAFADAKKANPTLKKHEVLQLMRATIEAANEDKSLQSLIFKTTPAACAHDHNSKDPAALYVDKQVRAAVVGLGLLDVVGGEQGAVALLLTRGGAKAKNSKRAYHFTLPEIVHEVDIIHPDAANPMPALAPGDAGVQLSQGTTAARKRSVGAIQAMREQPVTLSAVPRLDVHNSGATKVIARERTGACPKAALSLVEKSIPLDPATKKALLVTSATPAADNPGRTWTSKLQMGMKDVSEEDKAEYRAILEAQRDLGAFKENGTKPSQLSPEDMEQKLASARVLVDAIGKVDRLPYLKKPLAGLPAILANHPKELEPALRKLAAFHHKKASPRRKSPVPADLGVAPAQGVQKPVRRNKPEGGQSHLDRDAARHNMAEAKADIKLKRMKAGAKKQNAAAGLSRMVRGMTIDALPKAPNRKAAEAKQLKELQDNAAAADAEEQAAAAEKAEAEAASGDAEVTCADLFDSEQEEDDADQPEWWEGKPGSPQSE